MSKLEHPAKPDKNFGLFYYKQNSTVDNFVRMLTLPCQIPPSLYVEVGAEALVTALLEIGDFDPREVYHWIQGESMLCSTKKLALEAGIIKSPSESKFSRFLFTFGEVIDLLVWRIFLMGVLTEALHFFSSQIVTVEGCREKQNPNTGPGKFFFGAIPDTGEWHGLSYQFPSWSKFAPAWPCQVEVEYGEPYIVAATQSFHPFSSFVTIPTEARIHSVTLNQTYDHDLTNRNEEGELRDNHVWWKSKGNVLGGRELIQAQWRYTGGTLPEHLAFPHADGSCFLYQPFFKTLPPRP